MTTETDLAARLERDHAQLAAGFSVAKLPANVARRTRRLARRKTLALLASAAAGMLATAIATHVIAGRMTGGTVSAFWLIVISLCVALGALAGFVLLFAQEPE